jgi:hypothetical protein
LQFEADMLLRAEERQWLRCDIDPEGNNVAIVIARRDMLQTSIRRGPGEPLVLDATHGLQKYGLRLITGSILDEEGSGAVYRLLAWHKSIFRACTNLMKYKVKPGCLVVCLHAAELCCGLQSC